MERLLDLNSYIRGLYVEDIAELWEEAHALYYAEGTPSPASVRRMYEICMLLTLVGVPSLMALAKAHGAPIELPKEVAEKYRVQVVGHGGKPRVPRDLRRKEDA